LLSALTNEERVWAWGDAGAAPENRHHCPEMLSILELLEAFLSALKASAFRKL
jgi:hypothetical protein